MKFLRYIHSPCGKITIEEEPSSLSPKTYSTSGTICGRIEIYNIHGELVCVVTDKAMIRKLQLKKGFYLVREKDTNGVIVKSTKMVF